MLPAELVLVVGRVGGEDVLEIGQVEWHQMGHGYDREQVVALRFGPLPVFFLLLVERILPLLAYEAQLGCNREVTHREKNRSVYDCLVCNLGIRNVVYYFLERLQVHGVGYCVVLVAVNHRGKVAIGEGTFVDPHTQEAHRCLPQLLNLSPLHVPRQAGEVSQHLRTALDRTFLTHRFSNQFIDPSCRK